MKALSTIAFAATIAGLASACSVRHEIVERPAPVAVATVPAPGTIIYTDPSPVPTTTTVYTR